MMKEWFTTHKIYNDDGETVFHTKALFQVARSAITAPSSMQLTTLSQLQYWLKSHVSVTIGDSPET